ncbi:MAG: tetratricopeptide repeat protein, partial [Sinobacteraceae bacterium]|nr:tetratricopeptide repeat protein [Nevskiaceae bacterium]
ILTQPDILSHAKTANKVMPRLVALHDKEPFAHYAAGLLALRTYDATTAQKQARRMLQLAPGSMNATMLLAAAQIQEGKLPAADHTVAPLLAGKNGAQLRLGYVRILIEYGRYSHARQRLRELLKSNPHDNDALLLLAQTDLSLNRLDEAKHVLQSIPSDDKKRDSQVQLYLGHIAENRRDYAAALEHYKQAAQGGLRLSAGLRQARVLAETGHPRQARVVLAVLLSVYPQRRSDIIVVQSQILIDNGDTADALSIINQALGNAPHDDNLLYQRALLYDQMKRTPSAEKALRKLLDANPYDARYLNALGFVLAEHNPPQKLGEARQLIGRALAMAPEDPAVLDSMGWVLFRQGETGPALKHLQQAYTLAPDPQIAAHLVQVLAVSGKPQTARQTLDKALQLNPNSAALQAAEKYVKQ